MQNPNVVLSKVEHIYPEKQITGPLTRAIIPMNFNIFPMLNTTLKSKFIFFCAVSINQKKDCNCENISGEKYAKRA